MCCMQYYVKLERIRKAMKGKKWCLHKLQQFKVHVGRKLDDILISETVRILRRYMLNGPEVTRGLIILFLTIAENNKMNNKIKLFSFYFLVLHMANRIKFAYLFSSKIF